MAKPYLFINILMLSACQPQTPDLKEYLSGWEYVTTFKVLPSKKIIVFEKDSEIVEGNNNVLIISSEVHPIFKPGKHVTDLHSSRSILIELNNSDSIATPMNPGRSRIFRQVVAFSPQVGTHSLEQNEKITIVRKGVNRWAVDADLYDLQFKGIVSLTDSTTISSTRKEMYH